MTGARSPVLPQWQEVCKRNGGASRVSQTTSSERVNSGVWTTECGNLSAARIVQWYEQGDEHVSPSARRRAPSSDGFWPTALSDAREAADHRRRLLDRKRLWSASIQGGWQGTAGAQHAKS